MKKNTILFLLMLIASFSFLPQPVKAMDHYRQVKTGPDWKAVETEFYRLLNELRKQKKLTELTPNDPLLDSAAFDQARYMQKRRVVTHDQNSKKKASPFKRVQYYGGSFTIVGENCILIFVDTPMKTKKNSKTITVSDEKEIAAALFAGWKASPKHYK
ncbi:MAG: CAP domain-containing protein, partial [Bacteroidia bacterium]|nr:CAP domain-containing protein [Bacteroidia bacterium]